MQGIKSQWELPAEKQQGPAGRERFMYRYRARVGFTLAAVCGCAGMLLGCRRLHGGVPTRPANAVPPAVADAIARHLSPDADLVAADNAFGVDVFGRLAQADATKNVFLSPTSIALAVQIVANGAKGDTLAGMARALHLTDKTPAQINAGNAGLQASLVSADRKVQINIANSLWLHKNSAQVTPAFVAANVSYYGSDIGDLAGAPDAINAWVSNHTNGKITSIAGPNDYDQIKAIIINAVYFKGKWSQPFEAADTRPAPFTRLDGTNASAQMMYQSGHYDYYKGKGFQVTRLPYGSKRLSLLVALPDRGADWKRFLAGLSAKAISEWANGMRETHGDIGLPRFQSEYETSLNAPLAALGMGLAFDPGKADLSGIANGLYIQEVRHKTFLKVDEEGTEAAAVTSIAMAGAAAPSPGFEMTMDHPFVCAIRDDKTGALLFLGCVVDPTQ